MTAIPVLPLSLAEYRLILRTDFASFVHSAFHELNPQTPYICGAHIDLIAAKLEACRLGSIRRLIINLPPRNLKSHCASVAFPAWILGQRPAAHVICASYGQELAEKFARDTRRLMQSALFKCLFPTRLSDRLSVHDFATAQGGMRMATSVGGPLTGRGGDFIIIDDPMKPDEALSETRRKASNDWYDNTVLSRLNNKATGCIVIIMQRLHQDDLVGHVLEQEDWEVLNFPAIAESEEIHRIESPLGTRTFRRRPGDALHPERESVATLNKIRREIGEYNFASQYQQNPTPVGGAMVKTEWLKFYEPGSEPAKLRVIQSWDTANKAGELNDFSVCTTWAVRGRNEFYLLHVFRKRLNYPDLKRAVIEQKKRYRANVVVIEDKASGTPLIQELKREGILVKPYEPPTGTDKVMRLHSQAIFFENGKVLLPRGAPWLAEYVTELTSFPGGRFDDQVDSTTQFLDYMRQPGALPMVISEETLRRAAQRPPYRINRW